MLASNTLWPTIMCFLVFPFILEGTIALCYHTSFACFAISSVEKEVKYGRISSWINRSKYILLQIVVGLTFYTFPYSEFVKYVDQEGSYEYYQFNILFHVTQLICLIVYIITSLIDPAIIPSSTLILNTDVSGIKNECSPLLNTKKNKSTFKYSFEPIAIDIANKPGTFCRQCEIISPIRSGHDVKTGHCIARFDHHSAWIGNSIGANNHRLFVILLLLESFIFSAAFSLKFRIFAHLVNGEDGNFDDPFGWFVISFVLIYMFAVMIRTVPLFVYNCWYITKNITTFELVEPLKNIRFIEYMLKMDAKNEYGITDINFSTGIIGNWIALVSGYKSKQQYFYGLKCIAKDKDNDEESVKV
eukprot:527929_1